MQVLNEKEGSLAVTYARQVLNEHICREPQETISFPPVFSEKRGVFVTLTKSGDLRGCIGFPLPVMPLGAAIKDAAISAAEADPRFPPVRCPELPSIHIDITILSVPVLCDVSPIKRPTALKIGTHGLIVRGYNRSGLLLPQVAVEWGFDELTFLNQVCIKAGLPPESWKDPGVELLTFEGQIFTE